MIPKSVQRFSEKIMLKQRSGWVARCGSLADRDQAGTGFAGNTTSEQTD
jgi:hypothetical protein